MSEEKQGDPLIAKLLSTKWEALNSAEWTEPENFRQTLHEMKEGAKFAHPLSLLRKLRTRSTTGGCE